MTVVVAVRETGRQGYDSNANWAKGEVASKRILCRFVRSKKLYQNILTN